MTTEEIRDIIKKEVGSKVFSTVELEGTDGFKNPVDVFYITDKQIRKIAKEICFKQNSLSGYNNKNIK